MLAAIKFCQIKCDTRGRTEKYSNHLSNLFPELSLRELLLQRLTVLTINLCLTDYSINHCWPPSTCKGTRVPAAGGVTALYSCSICRNVAQMSIKEQQLLPCLISTERPRKKDFILFFLISACERWTAQKGRGSIFLWLNKCTFVYCWAPAVKHHY